MCAPGTIETLISNRIAYPAATDADVPGREGSSAALQSTYDNASLGFRVLVPNGNRYTKTSMTLYANGGRITQEDTGGGAAGVDDIFNNLVPVEVGDLVYKTVVADTVALAQADFTDTFAIGVVTAIVTASTCRVRMFGEATVTSALPYAVGLPVYLSAATPGRGTQTPPTSGGYAQMIGVANTTTTVLLGVLPQMGAGLLATTGSAAAPSMALYAYPTTGFYGAGVNTLGISVAGVAIGALSGTGLALFKDDITTNDYTNLLTLTHTATGGAGANNIGAGALFQAEGASGIKRAGIVGARLTTVTAGSEVGAAEMLGAYADTLAGAGLRVYAFSPSLNTGLAVLPSTDANATAAGVQLQPYPGPTSGATAINLSLGAVGGGELRARSNLTFATAACTIGTLTNNSLVLAPNGNGSLNATVAGTGGINLNSGSAGTGVSIGVDAASKVGFYATAPIAKQTGVPINAPGIHAALVALGLFS